MDLNFNDCGRGIAWHKKFIYRKYFWRTFPLYLYFLFLLTTTAIFFCFSFRRKQHLYKIKTERKRDTVKIKVAGSFALNFFFSLFVNRTDDKIKMLIKKQKM